ncbi:MAG: hypothetical protein LIR50_14870 [Bacillota bacterium]|nr:hypothetical protein [Bacillota bacterium]
MVINNLTNAFKTLTNPDLSTFQKITGILSSIAMTVPMIISSLASLKASFVSTGAAGEAMWASILGPIGWVVAGITAVSTVIGIMEEREK